MAERVAPGQQRRGRRSRWWAVPLVLGLPLVGVVAVGLAAPYLPPRPYWWAQLGAIALPYAAWALAAFAVVWMVGRQWSLGVIATVLVGAVAVRAGVLDRLSSPEPGDDDLVVVTFNVPEVGPSREALGDSVATFVRGAAPDIVSLQDAWVPGAGSDRQQAVQVEAVVGELPYDLAVPARVAGHPGWRSNSTGVPQMVRQDSGVEVVEQEALVLGVERDADVSLALRTHVRWRDRDAVLYNVHLRSFGEAKPWADADFRWTTPATWLPYLRRYRTAYAQRGDDVEQIARRVEGEVYPVVVTGDFNSTADNWAYRRLRTAGAERTDAFQAAGGWRWGRTYHADKPFVRIDYVLADPAFEVTSAQTAPTTFSDHRPVRVTLRWREAAP